MRKNFLYFCLILILTSCSTSTSTANSVDDLKWEETSSNLTWIEATMLDCTRVMECWEKDIVPDKYLVKETGQEVYIWASNSGFLGGYSTTLFVVVNRPSENTWDQIGLEYMSNISSGKWTKGWNLGIYGGEMPIYIGKVLTFRPIWYLSALNDSSFPIAYGATNESWAVIVSPKDADKFLYKFDPYYWQKQ